MADKVPVDNKQLAVNILGITTGMRREKKHCDFLIKVGSVEIPAHRVILCANSEFFDKMLSHPTVENKSGVVELKDVDPVCATSCIDHMYGEEVLIPNGKYEPMMFVATMLQLHTLQRAVLRLIEEKLNANSFFFSRRIANMYQSKDLEDACKEFAVENFSLITKEKEFVELDKAFIMAMIQLKNKKISEEEKLEALLKWNKHDKSRSSALMEMLKCIALDEVKVGYRRYLIENEKLIIHNHSALQMLSVSVMDTMGVISARPNEGKRIVVFDNISGHLQCFNPRDGTWRQLHEMNDEMKTTKFSAVTLRHHIYILMRNKSVYRLEYESKGAVWEKMADMIDDHGDCPPAIVFSGCIYVIGGHNGCYSKTVEKYNPLTNVWMKLRDKDVSSQASEVIEHNGHIYSFGGYVEGAIYLEKAEMFNPVDSSWLEIAKMKEKRGYVAAVECNNEIYILGGFHNVDGNVRHFCSVERYNLYRNDWTTLSPMQNNRDQLRGYVVESFIYAVGGYFRSPDSIEKYDITKDKWEMVQLPSGMKLKILESTEIELSD